MMSIHREKLSQGNLIIIHLSDNESRIMRWKKEIIQIMIQENKLL